MRPPVETVRAFLLRSVDYGDADRVLTCFSREAGSFSALARGARKSRRRFAGILQPFSLLELRVGVARGELVPLREAALLEPHRGIVADLRKIALAGAATEVVREALPPRQPEPEVFDALVEFTGALAGLEANASGRAMALLVAFELRVAALLGIAPGLGACGRCGKVPEEGRAALFEPRHGSLVCRACGGGTVKLSAAERAWLLAAVGPAWREHALGGRTPALESRLPDLCAAVGEHLSHRLRKALPATHLLEEVTALGQGRAPPVSRPGPPRSA